MNLARETRAATGLSQTAFAARYQVPLSTLRQWEQGVREPDAAAKNYLRLIARDPAWVAEALEAAA